VLEVRKELLRYPEAFRTSGLRVGWVQENIHACIVELKMTAHSEGCEAPTAYWPQAPQGQQQPIAVLDFTLFVVARWQRKRRVHKLDAEVERSPRGDEAIESIRGSSTRCKT
jgi:hypothetical protein